MRLPTVILPGLLAACSTPANTLSDRPSVQPQVRDMHDSVRERAIPTVLYGAQGVRPKPIAVLLPGYGLQPSDYAYLAAALVDRGYVVAGIQPQRVDDAPVPSGENLLVRRRPFWARGVADVRFVIDRLREDKIGRRAPIVVVGHSHGGDIAMLLAAEHPSTLAVAFSLDNRRMPMPRRASPRICSARSSDMPADPHVLPTAAEQTRFRMTIVPIAQMRHDDMSDAATDTQKAAIVRALARCLRSRSG